MSKDFLVALEEVLANRLNSSQSFEFQSVNKNNGVALMAVIIKDMASNIAPCIYLEQYEERYNNGEDIESLVNEILRTSASAKGCEGVDLSDITNWDKAKKNLVYRLVNKERNADRLKDAPHIDYLDLAIVFYIDLADNDEGLASTLVTNKMVKCWGNPTTDELITVAKANTEVKYTATVNCMSSMVSAMMCGEAPNTDSANLIGDSFKGENFRMNVTQGEPMHVVTNDKQLNGANAICYTGLCKAFAEFMENDFYIIPSSIHECLFVPCGGNFGADELRAMVTDVNNTQVQPTEILSYNVYKYTRATDTITIA